MTLSVTGTPDRFEFDLTAPDRPEVSQEEIAMALLGGSATGANALTLLSSDLLGATGRQIGLDALRIDRGDVVTDEFREDPGALLQDQDPVTRLTLSKRLSEQVEFTLSQNLAESGKTTILVSYYPLTNLEIRGISRDDGTQGLGVRHQITFGGNAARRVAAERVVLNVKEVLLEGSYAPFTAEQVRKDLKLKPGEPFDYYKWQQDLDGLTKRYVEGGHVEARVRGRRDQAGEGAINVVYTVSPGSRDASRHRWLRGPRHRHQGDRAVVGARRVRPLHCPGRRSARPGRAAVAGVRQRQRERDDGVEQRVQDAASDGGAGRGARRSGAPLHR